MTLVAIAGCTLLVDLEGLSDGLPPNDASTFESGAVSEPGDGGRPDTDTAPSLPYCAAARASRSDAAVLLCDDFDDPDRTTLGQGGWTFAYAEPLITLQAPFSFPRAARAAFGSDAGAGRGMAVAVLPFNRARTTLTVSARMRPHAGYQGPIVQLGVAGCVVVWNSGSVTNFCPGGIALSSEAAFVPDKWTRLELKLSRKTDGAMDVQTTNGEGRDALVSLGTLKVGDRGNGLPGDVTGVTLGFGQTVNDALGIVDFDDVLVTTE